MKLGLALAAFLPAVALARKAAPEKSIDLSTKSVRTSSKMGQKLMSQARKLENADEEVDATWLVDYEMRFQGCHHVSQFNEEADGEDEPKIYTKRLVRFRLCPANTCSSSNAGGCDSGYGDYIIDLNIFLEAYWQDKLEQEEYECEIMEKQTCAYCDDNDAEDCEYECYAAAGMAEQCEVENPYAQDEEDQEEFEVDGYMECAQWDIPDNNRNRKARRKLEDEVEYFIGPYCSEAGSEVNLGVFTDEFCTNFAGDDSQTHLEFYYYWTGEALPYSEESLIGNNCMSCKEREEVQDADAEDDGNDNNQDEEEEEPIELCEQLYYNAGKCETYLSPNSYYYTANENACNYMEGIKIMRTDGTVVTKSAASSKTAAAFIGVFATAFVLLGAYVYYLKTKLDRAKVELN